MALQVNLTLGLDNYPQAYARIVSKSGDNNKEKSNVVYFVKVWKSKAHRDANENEIDADRYEAAVVDLPEDSFAGCYEHLKTQAKYSGGTVV